MQAADLVMRHYSDVVDTGMQVVPLHVDHLEGVILAGEALGYPDGDGFDQYSRAPVVHELCQVMLRIGEIDSF